MKNEVKRKEKVPTESIIDNSITDFDLYLETQTSDELILYSGSGYHWYRDELQRLVSSGHTTLYTDRKNKSKIAMYYQVNSIPQLEMNLPPEERLNRIEDIGSAFTKCLFDGEVTEGCAHKAAQIASALTDCLLEETSSICKLKPLLEKDSYVLHHSTRVASYAVAMAITLGLLDKNHLMQIALGSLFHDIGKANIPEKILNKAGPLTDKEWSIMKSHPSIGKAAVKDTFLSQVSVDIIESHHERLDGSGYPNGVNKERLSPETQITTLADIFDALTSPRSYQKERTKFESLEFIKEKMLGTHVCPEIFLALVSTLSLSN